MAAIGILWIVSACAGPSAFLSGTGQKAGGQGEGGQRAEAQGTGAIVLRDALNMPVTLSMIPGGKASLCYVCDPSEVTCREGAVYFDSQAHRIKRKNIRPVCIFVASYEAARQEAARMGLAVPVFADASRAIPGRLIGQEIMPALILLDAKGDVSRVIVGGGESLDANISAMLEIGGSSRWTLITIAAPLVALAVILIGTL
jgi:hypothetical protein